MALLLLVSENIEHAKSALRGAFPHVKATHRAEAFASALGFRTYASLLAGLSPVGTHAPARSVELAAFSRRLDELGYQAFNPASLLQIVRSPAIPLRPWVEFKQGDLATNNRRYYECQRQNIPHITLETRIKYVTLSWDCISRDPKYDTHLGEDQGAILVRRMFATFQSLARHRPGKPMFEGSSFVGSVTNLMPDIARNLADEFFMVLVAPADQAIAA